MKKFKKNDRVKVENKTNAFGLSCLNGRTGIVLSGPYGLPVDNLLCYLIKFPGFRYGHGPERNLWFVDEANLILIRENKNDAPGKD